MIFDAITNQLQAVGLWLVDLLPGPTFDPSDATGGFPDPATTLAWVNAQQDIVTGGPGFIFNGGLLVAMLTSWLVIELAIRSVRTVVWLKKSLLF